jgi:flagellar basal-body rod protein FlgB
MAQPPIINGLVAAMRHLGERQKVIAQNLANSETAGYKAREVKTPDFAAMLGVRSGSPVARPSVQITGGMAALGARPTQAGSGVEIDTHVSETKPDGNTVTIEDQMLKMGQVQADYATLTNIYRKQMSLLKTAIGGR